MSLFWRTFLLLSLLLIGSVAAWLKTLASIEFEPRALQTAHQIVGMVKLARASVHHMGSAEQLAMRNVPAEVEGMQIMQRSDTDEADPPAKDALSQRIDQELQTLLGPQTMLASRINGIEGMWVGFALNDQPYWLRVDPMPLSLNPSGNGNWMGWLILALVLSLAGAALIALLINNPIRQLWLAASRVREGDYESSFLDETASTNVVREVNIGFNRMAQKLSTLEQERAVMLAGISHDLRTPLARLRLETELSVADERARAHMANDIEQLDRIIDKFLDYARPVHAGLAPVLVNDIIEDSLYALSNPKDLQVTLDLRGKLMAQGDRTELSRVFANLLENARRYGCSSDGIARVEITGRQREHWILLKVRDHGVGVDLADLQRIKQPFFRGDTARTSATGAGLGLAIIDKAIQRMGGTFALTLPATGGLSADIRLNLAQ